MRVAIGFTNPGAKGKAIGECWDNRCSGDGHFEIFSRTWRTRPAQLAAKCEACGHTVRTARKWLEMAGAPLRTAEGHEAMQHDPLDTEGEDAD